MNLSHFTDKQDHAFAAHILDLFKNAQEKYLTRFSAFLNLHESTLARQLAQASGYSNYRFYGGYEDAERVMLGVFAPYEKPALEQFPISPVGLTFRKEDTIGHRDILGSLMGLELRREVVGDILVGEGAAVCFLGDTVAPVVFSELKKIGRCGIKLMEGIPDSVSQQRSYQMLSLNVSALRLDCVTAAVTNLSREKSAQMIRAQAVAINGAPCTQTARNIVQGDILSIRGHGKFLFEQTNGETKRGRLRILCKKYV